MFYRSDWPEVGLAAALGERTSEPAEARARADWTVQSRVDGILTTWIAAKCGFESELYGFPIWECRLEVEPADEGFLDVLSSARLNKAIAAGIRQLVAAPPPGATYLFSRVIRTEPLHPLFLENGFEEVERRRIYRTAARGITGSEEPSFAGHVRFMSLAEFAPTRRMPIREQICDVCRDAFGDKGHSRHFTDPFLLKRLPGIAYILAAMELNFAHQEPAAFLLAVDTSASRALGFTVVGKKAGLTPNMYTQLLSAVRTECQGRNIYSGITQLLKKTLPEDATLLNVTHEGNRAIQAAYERSGRIHLADTVVVRRILQPGIDTS